MDQIGLNMKNRNTILLFSLRFFLPMLAGTFLLGRALTVHGDASPERTQPFRCKEPPCIPSVLIHSDDEGGRNTILIVDKQRQTASLWTRDNQWQRVGQWPCSTGKRPGRKEIEGDLKTPEGIYFVTRQVPGRYLSGTYGSRALPLDYPNWQDRITSRGGSAIWLHGTNKPLKPLDSNGCIVFKNKSINELSRRIEPRRTPVILVDAQDWQAQGAAESKARTILPIITRWKQALLGGSYQRLKQWYVPGAAPSMAWWHRWCRLRNNSALARGTYHSLIKNRLAIQYHDQIMVLFDHYLKRGQKVFWCGRIKMYLRVAAHRVRILKSTYLDHNGKEDATIADDPLFHAWKRMSVMEYGGLTTQKGKRALAETGF